MATDLSRPRELLETIWQRCEPVMPTYPPPGRTVRINDEIKQWVREKFSDSIAIVTNALEAAAAWLPDEAEQLREHREKLDRLWWSTFDNIDADTRAAAIKLLPDQSIEARLEVQNSFNGMGLMMHIRRVGQYARSLLQSLEAAEVKQTPANGDVPQCAHSDDFRSVRWYGRDYSFTGNQAACVKVLWEALERGTPDVGAATLLEAAGASTERVDMVFRDDPAWGTMIVGYRESGGRKGTYRLVEPTADAPKLPKRSRKKPSRRARK